MTPPATTPADAVAGAGGLGLPAAAVAYARAGLLVFPCVPGEKRPLTEHGFTDASTDLARVAAWWRRWPRANVGLASGRPGGFDVLDIDVHPGGSGFPALRRVRQAGLADGWAALVRSPSGGVHLYFPVDPEREQRSWAIPRAHVDFRGAGGYVIAPPSQVMDEHGGGRGYRLIATGRDPQPVDAGELRRLLDPPRPHPQVRPGIGLAGGSGERLGAWLAAQPEGNRNRALFWAACRQAEAGVPQDEARLVLGSAAGRTGLGEREIDATLASAYDPAQHASAPIGWLADFHAAQDRLREWVALSGTRLDRDRPTRQTIWPGEQVISPAAETTILNRDEDFVAFVIADVNRRAEAEAEFLRRDEPSPGDPS